MKKYVKNFYAKQVTISASGSMENISVAKQQIRYVTELISKKKLKPNAYCVDKISALEIEKAYKLLQAKNRKPGTVLLDWEFM